jgi:hypothetical protein
MGCIHVFQQIQLVLEQEEENQSDDNAKPSGSLFMAASTNNHRHVFCGPLYVTFYLFTSLRSATGSDNAHTSALCKVLRDMHWRLTMGRIIAPAEISPANNFVNYSSTRRLTTLSFLSSKPFPQPTVLSVDQKHPIWSSTFFHISDNILVFIMAGMELCEATFFSFGVVAAFILGIH